MLKSNNMKTVITDFIQLDIKGRQKLEKIPDIKIYDDCINDPKIIIDRIKDAEIVTASYIDLNEEIIINSPKLKYIISPAKGFDWIDIKAANLRGIKVLNCPTFNANAVAEHAIALMFATQRKIVAIQSSILDGKYPNDIIGSEISGKTLITIGYGEIGKKVIKMAQGLGMKTKLADSKTTPNELDNLISEADVLVACLPLNTSTNGLIDKSRLHMLKTSAIIINVARGLIIDNDELYKMLKNNEIAGAGIDVFPKDEVIIAATEDIIKMAQLPNVTATSHLAFNTFEAAERLGDELAANIESCLINKPINLVN